MAGAGNMIVFYTLGDTRLHILIGGASSFFFLMTFYASLFFKHLRIAQRFFSFYVFLA